MTNHFVYVVLSHTDTKVGKAVRMVTGVEYNHASLSFDMGLKEMYAFARPLYRAPALGRLVHETTGMYTRNGLKRDVPIKVYAVPISEEQRDRLHAELLDMATSNSYIYNFPSALSFPFLHGVRGDRMYTCCEFVAWCIKHGSIELERPIHAYGPAELADAIEEFCTYEGPILEYAELVNAPPDFFKRIGPVVMGSCLTALGLASVRMLKQVLNCGR